MRRFILFIAATLVFQAAYSQDVKWGSFSSPDNRVINGAGGNEQIMLSASCDWSLSSSEDWLIVSPAAGEKGNTLVKVTTSENTSGFRRTGAIVVHPFGDTLTVTQYPYIYTREIAASGNVSNAVSVYYSLTEFTKIYTVLPVPQSCMYQDISNFTSNGEVMRCRNNDNLYVVSDLTERDIPFSGGSVLSSSFDVTAYSVTANLSIIDGFAEPDYDSEPYTKYLGDEKRGYISPSNPIIKAFAQDLWNAADGDLIDYARRCYVWTAVNMSYGNPYTDLHPIKELMRTKTGDCANYSSVFISLLRAKDIPARHIVMIEPNKAGKHVRAEFYLPGYGWIPCDPEMERHNPHLDTALLYFGRFTGKYVVLSLGINSLVKTPTSANYMIPLLQTYNYWCWYSIQGEYSFRHLFSPFE